MGDRGFHYHLPRFKSCEMSFVQTLNILDAGKDFLSLFNWQTFFS